MDILIGILTFMGALLGAIAIILVTGAFSIWLVDLFQNLLGIN